ncbi:hypothetical protein Drorol1_Dr00002148 [Drosera rotundifolia]
MKQGTSSYADAFVDQYISSQTNTMQQQQQQHNAGINAFPGRPVEQWQWDRDTQTMSPGLHPQGQVGTADQSFYENQISDTKVSSKQESSLHTQEQDMEIGYEDNPSPKTFETLEQKFRNDIGRLIKEHADAEDAENSRHMEKIVKINDEYQEKISALRAQHAFRREEFLMEESQLRFQQYQCVGINHSQNNRVALDKGHPGFGRPPVPGPGPGGLPAEAQGPFTRSQFDSYRQHPESFGRGRGAGADARVPSPRGRVYNSTPRYY